MGYFITGLLCFIAGCVATIAIYNKRKKVIISDHTEVIEIIKKNAHQELKKIKEKLSKGTKEKDRDEIIKDIDNYFTVYGNPFDRDIE